MNRFYSSDHHFGHRNVISYCNRPFKDEIEMTVKLIQNWNSVVAPNDEVYYLGDFSLSDKYARDITNKLNGKKYLVAGNHDGCHPVKSKSDEHLQKMIRKYKDWGWEEVYLTHTIRFAIEGADFDIRLCHLPYSEPPTTGQDQRHQKWRPPDDGMPLICGHVHQHWTMRRTEKRNTKMINVGVDVWGYKPVPEVEVCRLLISGGL